MPQRCVSNELGKLKQRDADLKAETIVFWSPAETPHALHGPLEELAHFYPIRPRADGIRFKHDPATHLAIDRDNGRICVTYAHPAGAWRAISYLLSGQTEPVRESPDFETAGIMLDCSRNAVPTIAYLEDWIRRMALFGFNLLMLYTEDTYQLEDEPFFGYQRGGYSKAEIRAVDDYAARFGIELVPCIQTLGHMEQMFRWECYSPIRDLGAVMLADEDRTYAFIAKILDFWSDAVRSRRIHVGMDETHALGRGAYLNRHGYHPPREIILKHLTRVHDLCVERGMRPMMWSDMLVPHARAKDAHSPVDLATQVPATMDLVCWDYYNESEEHYTNLIQRNGNAHRILMSPAVWCWATPWYGREYTENRLLPALRACKKQGVKEVIVTMWNDDGGYGDLDSCWNGLALAAEDIYRGAHLESRYAAVFAGVPYHRNRKIAILNDEFSAMGLLWDDPLLGIYWHQRRATDKAYWEKRLTAYHAALRTASGKSLSSAAGDLPKIRLLLRFLIEKIDLRDALEATVLHSQKMELYELATRFRRQSKRVRQLSDAWRKYWFARYKPFGWEVLQNRLSAQAGRQEETALRLMELAADPTATIPELDAQDICCTAYPDCTWRANASGSVII